MTLRPLALAAFAFSCAVLAQPQPPAAPEIRTQIREHVRHLPLDERFLADLDEQLSGLPASAAFIANEFGHP